MKVVRSDVGAEPVILQRCVELERLRHLSRRLDGRSHGAVAELEVVFVEEAFFP